MKNFFCAENVKIDRKLYLATFEFISGEYGQIFYKAFYVEEERDLEMKIHNYLVDYYGKGKNSNIEGNRYYYWNSEVAVKIHGWEEIIDLEQIALKLA